MTHPDNSRPQSIFSGVVTGRCLLQVVGVRSATEYKSDKEADEFWLILEGDTPDHVLWLHPHWRYFGANDGFQMACETQMLELGQRPNTVPFTTCAGPEWQALTGLHLQAVHSPYLHAPPHTVTVAMSVQFGLHEKAIDGEPTASLLFDSEDMDEPYIMVISDDHHLGHWALNSDVQHYLNNTTPWTTVWNARWNTPPEPWDDRSHFEAIAALRAALQDFALWWQTQTDWPVSSRFRQSPMPELWQALDAACALQIALSHGLAYPPGVGCVDIDSRAQVAGQETNLLFGLGNNNFGLREQANAAYAEEMQRLRDGIVNVIRWMAWDDWHPLLGPESGGMYTQTKTRWNTLRHAYLAWF